MRKEIENSKDKYIREHFGKEDAQFSQIHDSAPDCIKGMQITPEEGKLINILLKMLQAKTVLEIGTFVGYSTAWIADAISKTGTVFSIEKSQVYYNLAKNNLKDFNNVKLILGEASEVLETLTAIQFDAIFIDADKASYCIYLDFAEKHLKRNGLLLADNTFLFNTVYDKKLIKVGQEKMWDAMNNFNFRLSNSEIFENAIIPTLEGLSIAIRK